MNNKIMLLLFHIQGYLEKNNFKKKYFKYTLIVYKIHVWNWNVVTNFQGE